MSKNQEVFSENDVNEFSRKLESWGAELSPKEMAMFRYIVNAPAASEKVSIFHNVSISVATSSRLADIVGVAFDGKPFPNFSDVAINEDAGYW